MENMWYGEKKKREKREKRKKKGKKRGEMWCVVYTLGTL